MAMMTSREVLSMTKHNFIRRSSMFILFICAMYTTVSSISNITLADMKIWIEEESQTILNKSNNNKSKQLSLKEKIFNKRPIHVSAEHNLIPNDEEINLAQYPSKTVVATGYTAGYESTGKTPDHPEYGITYSGVEVKRDLYSTIAADIDVFPLGTILYIPDYGYGIVADIGSAIKGNKIDLYYPTVEDVYAKWGKKEVEVYIIKLGDGQLSEDDFDKLNRGRAVQVGTE